MSLVSGFALVQPSCRSYLDWADKFPEAFEEDEEESPLDFETSNRIRNSGSVGLVSFSFTNRPFCQPIGKAENPNLTKFTHSSFNSRSRFTEILGYHHGRNVHTSVESQKERLANGWHLRGVLQIYY